MVKPHLTVVAAAADVRRSWWLIRSREYAMIPCGGGQYWIDERAAVLGVATGIRVPAPTRAHLLGGRRLAYDGGPT